MSIFFSIYIFVIKNEFVTFPCFVRISKKTKSRSSLVNKLIHTLLAYVFLFCHYFTKLLFFLLQVNTFHLQLLHQMRCKKGYYSSKAHLRAKQVERVGWY